MATYKTQAAEIQVDKARAWTDGLLIDGEGLNFSFLTDTYEREAAEDFDADPIDALKEHAKAAAELKVQRRNKPFTSATDLKTAILKEQIAVLSEIVQTIFDDPNSAAATKAMWKQIIVEGA